MPLLDTIFHDEGSVATISDLTLTIRAGGGGQPFGQALAYTFAQLSVGAFAENLSGSLSGTATLVVRPR